MDNQEGSTRERKVRSALTSFSISNKDIIKIYVHDVAINFIIEKLLSLHSIMLTFSAKLKYSIYSVRWDLFVYLVFLLNADEEEKKVKVWSR